MDRRGRAAWAGLCVLLGGVALLGWNVPRDLIDWQPQSAWREPWRAVSAVGVHYSALHLAANLAGTLVVGAFGWAARVPQRMVVAWALAWPLTQALLLVAPQLEHYGGLSGVLHAGVAVVAVQLICAGSRAERRIGAAVAGGLAIKLLIEQPWGAPLRFSPGWDIAVAPLAHASGVVAGGLFAVAAHVVHRCRSAGSP